MFRPAARFPGGLRMSVCLLALVLAPGLAAGQVADCAADTEPNNTPDEGQRLEVAMCVTGELGSGDQDLFWWTVAGESPALWTLELEGVPGQRTKLDVLLAGEPGGAVSKVFTLDVQGVRSMESGPLLFAPGRYLLGVGGSGEGPYRFDLRLAGALPEAVGGEPGDPAQEAVARIGAFVLSGDLTGSSDAIRWSVPPGEAPHTWRLSAQTILGLRTSLKVLDAEGSLLAERKPDAAGRMVLDDLSSPAGELVIELARADRTPAPYLLRVEAAGEGEDGRELEPNDTIAGAFPLDEKRTVRGRLVGAETDVYRFEVEGEPMLWRAQVLARDQPVRAMRHYDAGGNAGSSAGASGERRVRLDNLLLLPGEHFIAVEGEDSEYLLKIVAIGPADSKAGLEASRHLAGDVEIPGVRPPGLSEFEPNHLPAQAGTLRVGAPRIGLLTDPRDVDQYRFHLAAEQPVRVRVEPPEDGRVVFDVTGGTRSESSAPGEPAIFEGWLLPGDHWISVRPREPFEGFYQVGLEQLDPFLTPAEKMADVDRVSKAEAGDVAPAVVMGIKGRIDSAAAYWQQSQVLDLGLWVQNLTGTIQTLRFEVATSDAAWKGRLLREVVEVGPAQSAAIPLQVEILPDARDDQPVLLTVAARTASGAVATASVELQPECGAEPRAAGEAWPLPDRLLGGLNVAWPALGAAAEGEDRFVGELFDGLAIPLRDRTRFETEQAITVDLAGEEPVELWGALLHPLGRSIEGATEQLAEFSVSTSLDGKRFEEVLTGRLEPLPGEQVFAFEEPVEARFARLVLGSSHGGGRGVALGEWKLVAAAGTRLRSEPWDIAQPSLGGHVAWSDPLIGTEEFGTVIGVGSAEHPILSVAAERTFATTADDQDTASWVVGFHHDRAARITGFEWVPSESRSSRALGFEEIEVAASTESPLGPWETLATWRLGGDGVERLTLGEPAWARFVRFTAGDLRPQTPYRYPETLRIFEQGADADYRSILGEWGFMSRRAIFEAGRPASGTSVLAEADHNDSRERAQPLSPGRALSGRVLVEEDVDWYRVEVPEGHNAIRITLQGDPAVAFSWSLQDPRGRPVESESERSYQRVELTADVAPGSYYLRLEEPPRSVVLAWDTSASIGPYTDFIRAAATQFARAVKPGREVVNLLPFDKPPRFLLEEWSGDPAEVMSALNRHDTAKAFSSNSELALLTAGVALEKRPGARAIVLITDAFSNGYALTTDLWKTFAQTSPQIFTMHTPSIEHDSPRSAASQDLMQSWAGVGGGFYDSARTIGHFDVGFARASCYLRRPKSYRVLVETGFEEPAGPGSIEVVAAATDGAAPGTAGESVEVIFDASGSMYRKVGGVLRIDVAKRVLRQLVSDVLSPGTPFALRVFGNRKAKACRTDLEMPLGPLDAAETARVLAAVEPKPFSGTPIAASLELVGSDLGEGPGPKRVVLVTDGEESCGGDVEAAIEALRRRGYDVELNIVGFDVDASDREAARARFRRWAELGGGRYYDAGDARSLEESMVAAVSRSFDVVDHDGAVLATGAVGGDPVAVPAGVYTVRVKGAPAEIFEQVRVVGEKRKTLTLGSRP